MATKPASATARAGSGATRRHAVGTVTSRNSGIANSYGSTLPMWIAAHSSGSVRIAAPSRSVTSPHINSAPSTLSTAAIATSRFAIPSTDAFIETIIAGTRPASVGKVELAGALSSPRAGDCRGAAHPPG